ncbi:CHASE2 domain-containing protein [Sphingomonas sp. CROZ-RG-20F-R02-07]|uniref:CHASE2 domain-containing protein n=1 Tax=Sphingomonas sp. CROZ-RG-20F-R02-07 TaxID=2914832 RepID=UPI001F572297|nr:CHASE2 domain-containing protein [Sphingomonas sp. CROZ-RG-20F-R02-07]
MTKQIRTLLTLGGVAAIATLFAVLAVHYLTFLGSLENIARDVRIAGYSKPMPQSKDIVIAAIDESTVAQFPYRSPVDRAFLATLVKQLEAKGAREVGIDVLFDQPTEPAKDAELARTLREAKVPLFVSYTNSGNIVDEDQLKYLNAFVPKNLRAGANLATDPFDDSVRWIFPGETNPGMPMGFVRKALAVLGIKTPRDQVEIAWRPNQDAETPAFPQFPAQTVGFLPDDWIKGKIVLIGAVQSITDRHRTPLAIVDEGDRGNMPGIIVQAHGISQYLEGRTASRLGIPAVAAVTLIFALIGVGLGLLKRGPAIKFGIGSVVVVLYWLGAILGYAKGVPLVPLVAPTLAFAVALWLTDVVIGRAERKQRQFIQGAFSRYVSPAVVSQLAADPESLSISGTKREVTFIFTDIAGFTTLSEGLTSEKLSEVLNDYLDGACAIILKYEGTIDKFIGDAIMSIFNAPIAQPDHAERAVKCALELDAYAESFRKAQNAVGVPIGVTRIGIHTGHATVGNFGSSSRMDFTALGDTVNTAARTEGVNKYFGTRICVTEETVAQCPNLAFRRIGDVVLKGKTKPVGLFQPVSAAEAASGLVPAYDAALAKLSAGAPDAVAAFDSLDATWPGDPIVAYHRARFAKGTTSSLIVLEDK